MAEVHQGVFQPHLVSRCLERHADQVVLVLPDGDRRTGAQVAATISQTAQALSAMGVKKGDCVAILAGNREEVLAVSIAAMFIEALYVPFHPMGSVDDFAYVAEDAGVDVVIFDARMEDRIVPLMQRGPSIRRFLSLGPSRVGEDMLPIIATGVPTPLVAPDLRGDEVFRLAYSGGTTGKPKAILSTHEMVHALTVIQLAEWEWPEETRFLLCAPLSHSGSALFLPTLMRGGVLHIQEGFDPLQVLQAIERERITCTLLVPTMIYALLDHPRFDEFDLSSLETVFYGASPMSVPRLREAIERIGPVFFQFYGQAEAPMSVSVLRRAEHDAADPLRLSSCGRPVPWVHVSLRSADGREVPRGEPGEICVRGPLVMPGYHNKPEQTAEALRDGWLHSGDIALCDEDGFLRIIDRSKDMIITGGFNVYPREVEDALASHPAVVGCAVFGLPDARWGESVTAAVVLRDGAKADVRHLCAHVRERKGAHQAPKRIEFVDALPLTAVGKIDKKALRARFDCTSPAA